MRVCEGHGSEGKRDQEASEVHRLPPTGPEQRCRWPWPWPWRRRVLSDTDMAVVERKEAR